MGHYTYHYTVILLRILQYGKTNIQKYYKMLKGKIQ